jgi:uracil-DNA glycosylase family 4
MGQFPGKEEDRSGHPMQGIARELTRWALGVAGLEWDQVFFSNVLGCKPPTGSAKQAYIKACTARVEELILIGNPAIIISMGSVAGKFFARDNKATMGLLAARSIKYAPMLDPQRRQFEVFCTTNPYEPDRHKKSPAKRDESFARLQREYTELKCRLTELGIVERLIE